MGAALRRLATMQAIASDKDGTNTKSPFQATPPMPLDPMLAQSYQSIRLVSKAFETYTPDTAAEVEEGDRLDFGDGRLFIVVAVEKWTMTMPHLRLVLEERG